MNVITMNLSDVQIQQCATNQHKYSSSGMWTIL